MFLWYGSLHVRHICTSSCLPGWAAHVHKSSAGVSGHDSFYLFFLFTLFRRLFLKSISMLLPLSRSVVAANTVLMALASIAVAFRIIARRKQRLPLKADDFTIIAALVRNSLREHPFQTELTELLGNCDWLVHRRNLCRSHQHICHSNSGAFSAQVARA